MRKARARQTKVSLDKWELIMVVLQKATIVGHAFCIFLQHGHHNTLTDTAVYL